MDEYFEEVHNSNKADSEQVCVEQQTEFTVKHFDSDENLSKQKNLDFVDKVIAAYDINLINQAETRKEVRKAFYDSLSY